MQNVSKAAIALMGILLYKNRNRLDEILGPNQNGGSNQNGRGQRSSGSGGLGGLLGGLAGGGLGGALGGGGLGGALGGGAAGGGLGDLIERFRNAGHGDTADTWVRQGQNQPLEPHQLEQSIDPEVLDELSQQTGMSRDELLTRLSKNIPEAVDEWTPNGRLEQHSDDSLLDVFASSGGRR
jgi:uncharacterized protein YidB (DUF937 family)